MISTCCPPTLPDQKIISLPKMRLCAAIIGLDPSLGTIIDSVYRLYQKKPLKTHHDFDMLSSYPPRSENHQFTENAAVRCCCRLGSFIGDCNRLCLCLNLGREGMGGGWGRDGRKEGRGGRMAGRGREQNAEVPEWRMCGKHGKQWKTGERFPAGFPAR